MTRSVTSSTTSTLSTAKTVSTVRSAVPSTMPRRAGRGNKASKASNRRIANPSDQLTVQQPDDHDAGLENEGLTGPAGLVSSFRSCRRLLTYIVG